MLDALSLIQATVEPGNTSLETQLKAAGFQKQPETRRAYASYGLIRAGDFMNKRVNELRPRVRVWVSRSLKNGPDTVFVTMLGMTVWLSDFESTAPSEIVLAARKATKLFNMLVLERDRVLLHGSEDLVIRLVKHYYGNTIAESTILKDLCDVKTGGLRGLPRNIAQATVEPQGKPIELRLGIQLISGKPWSDAVARIIDGLVPVCEKIQDVCSKHAGYHVDELYEDSNDEYDITNAWLDFQLIRINTGKIPALIRDIRKVMDSTAYTKKLVPASAWDAAPAKLMRGERVSL